MPTIACLAGRAAAAAIGASLCGRAVVTPFDDRAALVAHVRSTPVAAVVVALRDEGDRPTTGTVRALRGAAPRLPVFAWCRLAESDCRALLDFARAGGTDVLVEGTAHAALRAAVAAYGRPSPSVDALVARLVAGGVPPGLAPVLEHLLAHVDDPDAPARAADRMGVGRRALERRLARASLPSPRVLHGWCRLLVAAERLCVDTGTVERIAHDVGYASGNALRNALQRYGATTPTALRGGDGAEALEALVGRLRGRRRAAVPTGAAGAAGAAGAGSGPSGSDDTIGYGVALPGARAGAALLVRETVAAWLLRAVRGA